MLYIHVHTATAYDAGEVFRASYQIPSRPSRRRFPPNSALQLPDIQITYEASASAEQKVREGGEGALPLRAT